MRARHAALAFGSSLLVILGIARLGYGQEAPTAVTIGIEEVAVIHPPPPGEEPSGDTQTLRLANRQQNSDRKTQTERLVVLPVAYLDKSKRAFESELEKTFGIANTSSVQQPDFTVHLINALVNRKKLRVLERQALPQVVKEIDFGQSDYADSERAVEIGHMLNADFVVVPRIRSVRLKRKEDKVPYIPKVDIEVSGLIATAVRVVAVKTGVIVYSRIGQTKHAEQLRTKADGVDAAFDFAEKLFASAAIEEASRIIAVTSPMKIIEINRGERTVILQAGAEEVKESDILSVMRPGAGDADLRERTLTGVGMLKVKKVYPDRIEATIEQGDVNDVTKDSVCMLMN